MDNQIESKKPMTTDEAAEYLGVNRSQIKKLAREGKIPAHKPVKAWYFIKEEIDEWIKKS